MLGWDIFAYGLHELHHSLCYSLVQLPGDGGRAVYPGTLLGDVARSREWAQKSSFGMYQLEQLLEEGG